MADSSGYGLLQCLQKLSDEEFLLFKELLRKEPKKFKLKPISWPMIKNASKEDVVTLLNTHYPGKAPDVVMSLLRQLNRKDLVTVLRNRGERPDLYYESLKTAGEHLKFTTLEDAPDKQNRYKGLMRTTFEEIWALETKTLVPDRSYHIIIKMQYQALLEVFRSKSEPVTAVVLGTTGEGKTTFLKKAMLNWALGILWEKRFQYVFFISVFSLNNIPELSLAELIASKLPKSSETPDDILSRPKRILFILDGFDYLKFDLELRTNLCDDWRKRLPTQIVLSSLLQKIMLPESSLLLELGNSSAPKIYPLLQYPRAITIGGFTADSIQFYCLSVFNYRQGLQVFENIRNCQLLLTLCRNPYFCWLFCSSLKWQLGSGEERDFVTGTDSGSYTTFLVNAFKSVYANTSLNTSRTLLRNLCSLAVEGMWKQAFVFDSEDLRRNGISEDNKGAWLRMEFLQKRGSHFVFYHPSLQSYFAALFYFLRQEKDAPHPVVGSLSQVLGELYAHGQTRWLQTGIFVFGIGNPRVTAMLQPVLGHLPFKEVKQEIIRYLRNLSQRQNSEKLLSPESLSFCLLDSQEEKFVKQAMGLFEEMTVDVSNSEILTVISYGLPRATKLKKLRLHIQNVVFSEYIDPEYYGTVETFTRDKLNAITHWRILCSIFHKLHVLDLDSCNFNKEAFQIFCESLSPSHIMEPENTFKLKSLSCSFMTNFGDGSLLKTFPQLPHLKSLNLYGTNLSVYMVEGLCSALSSPTCKVEVLLLGKCNISSEACGIIATSINYHKLRHLSLVENPLKDKGVMFLCEILKRPTCVLETLMLSYCCLTFIACGHLYDGILGSQHLSLLDLGSNFLEDTGANILCEALKDPMCLLQELWLSGCYFTSECCERLSATLTCSRNLKTLKLGNNDIQDTGVKQLCEALRHPNCKLQCLGLDMCELTTSCCEDLASALTTCKTLTNLNLDWIALDHNGLVVLCEALTSRHCRLKILGLDKSALSEESQKLLEDVQHHKKV